MKNGKLTMINFADRPGVKAVCIALNMLMVLLTIAPTLQAAQRQQEMNLLNMERQAVQHSRALSATEMGGIVGREGKGSSTAAKTDEGAKPASDAKEQLAPTSIDKSNAKGDLTKTLQTKSGEETNSYNFNFSGPKSVADGSGAAGGLAVNKNSGAATMSIPLKIIPGRNGMTPDLRLEAVNK